MRKLLIALAVSTAFVPMPSFGQSAPDYGNVVTACGTTNGTSYAVGTNRPVTVDTTGKACSASSATISGTVTANQGTAGASAWPVATTPTQRTIVALDVATVTTGGTAVTALTAGHRTAGGFLLNPIGATINLCINEQATASGTVSAGALTCILPGQTYNITPAAGAVSVITSDSSHPFSGQGLN